MVVRTTVISCDLILNDKNRKIHKARENQRQTNWLSKKDLPDVMQYRATTRQTESESIMYSKST